MYGGRVCSQRADGGWLGQSEGLSSSALAQVTQTAMDAHQPTAAVYIHTRAVEPLVPYVDNIHEVIKKLFVAS